jgi:glutaminyl-peptide cyclotransferase
MVVAMNKKRAKPSRRLSGQTVFLAVVLLGACIVLGYMLFGDRGSNTNAEAAASRLRLEDIPFNGARAYEYLKQVCAIGRRPSGSPGMAAQQKLLADHFQKLGGQVELQRFTTRHPLDGSPVPITNLIVHWHPESSKRILLCTHYDTLPFPLRDPVNKRGTFVGANDGASGVAVLMELAHEMPKLQCNYGVDFALFDAEEFIFSEQGRYFVGSEHFARTYVKNRPPYRYRWGVLLDMIGDADLQIYQERYSISWRDTRPLVQEIWATAHRLGVREFVPRKGYLVRDDHLPLHNIGRIPCCDLIDFDYPPWHTQGDTPERCSALSLAKVGWVIREWLKAVK